MNNALTIKKGHQHALDVWPDLPCSLCTWRGLMFGLWVLTVNQDFISCCDTGEEVTVVSDFVQQFLAHTNTLLLLVCEQLWHKFWMSLSLSFFFFFFFNSSLHYA
jgi:hypothetical protein